MNEDKYDLTVRHLSFQEAHIFASNLNQIENARNAQRNPTGVTYLIWMIEGISAIPICIWFFFDMLCYAVYFWEVFFQLIILLGIMFLDVLFIRACWRMFKND